MDQLGGFLPEDSEPDPREFRPPKVARLCPTAPEDQPICLECGNLFPYSFLIDTFNYSVCDGCKDLDEQHRLITRTDAKDEFLLKDCDLDLREPPLKFLSKKNPRNARWGEMKLYLRKQVQERSIQVWGSEDNLHEQKKLRLESREGYKQKKFAKRMKELRKNVAGRAPVLDRAHTHQYGEELHDLETDAFYKVCKICNNRVEYEKM